MFSNKWLGKPIGKVFFVGMSFGGKFELRASSLTWSSSPEMPSPQFSFWMCNRIFKSNLRLNNIFPYTHILWHHLNFHCIIPWIKWLLLTFLKRLWARPKPQAFFLFFQIDILTHAPSINKWYFWNGFWAPSRLLSPKIFNEWILSIVSTLFSYRLRFHSTSNCMCFWSNLSFSYDQAFRWS